MIKGYEVLQHDNELYGGIRKETVAVPQWLCDFTELFQLRNSTKLGLSRDGNRSAVIAKAFMKPALTTASAYSAPDEYNPYAIYV
jgi:hypothetical protein